MCIIQVCLQRVGYKQEKCKKEIQAFEDCIAEYRKSKAWQVVQWLFVCEDVNTWQDHSYLGDQLFTSKTLLLVLHWIELASATSFVPPRLCSTLEANSVDIDALSTLLLYSYLSFLTIALHRCIYGEEGYTKTAGGVLLYIIKELPPTVQHYPATLHGFLCLAYVNICIPLKRRKHLLADYTYCYTYRYVLRTYRAIEYWSVSVLYTLHSSTRLLVIVLLGSRLEAWGLWAKMRFPADGLDGPSRFSCMFLYYQMLLYIIT